MRQYIDYQFSMSAHMVEFIKKAMNIGLGRSGECDTSDGAGNFENL